MKKSVAAFALSLLILFLGCRGALAEARAAILVESTTGRVLYEKNADERLPMASTTKIMTALLAIERGDPADIVTAGPNAFGVPGTSLYLSLGEQLTLEEMLYGLMLASGNDAAVAIAEHIGGTVEEFCGMMTARARELGCENTVFLTPHGLPAQGHYTTARDLSTITLSAMRLPLFRQIVSTQRVSLPWQDHGYDRVLANKNKLLSTYAGALGVKTGYTRAAGRCLVFAAEREELSLVGAVLNCPDWFDQAAAILDEGFAEWKMAKVLSKDETVRFVAVRGGTAEAVRVVAGADAAAPVRREDWPQLTISLPDLLDAGIRAGQQVGTASLVDHGQTLLTVPLLAAEDVPQRSFRTGWQRFLSFWLLR
ncbi:MAG: D-alanyl-D-alanine carboxypeptidase [Clostridia bacterium]|nr:D-alanyl-D-alanine carboxypeptidase [Clostridia bacterium]